MENPSSYPYFNGNRAQFNASAQCGSFCTNLLDSIPQYKFAPQPSTANCSDYNEWTYGLQGARNAYVNASSDPDKIARFLGRNVFYMAGTNDTCNSAFCPCDDSSLDTSCGAEAQGRCRLERAIIWTQFLRTQTDQLHHKLVFVPGVGHDYLGMASSPVSQPIFFNFNLPVDPNHPPDDNMQQVRTSTSLASSNRPDHLYRRRRHHRRPGSRHCGRVLHPQAPRFSQA